MTGLLYMASIASAVVPQRSPDELLTIVGLHPAFLACGTGRPSLAFSWHLKLMREVDHEWFDLSRRAGGRGNGGPLFCRTALR
jgi:hypothetical protein